MNSGSGPLISIVDNVQLKCGHKTPPWLMIYGGVYCWKNSVERPSGESQGQLC